MIAAARRLWLRRRYFSLLLAAWDRDGHPNGPSPVVRAKLRRDADVLARRHLGEPESR